LLILIIRINTFVFSQSESWLHFGFENSNFFERALIKEKIEKSYLYSPGINLSLYKFWNNKNIGFFNQFTITSPLIGFQKIDEDNVDIIYLHCGFISGLGFKYQLNEKLIFKYGIGLEILTINSLSGIDINFGIGSDIGIKYNIKDLFFINIGSIFTIDFAQYKINTIRRIIFDLDYGWAKNYSMIGIRPYISCGINIKREE